MRKTLFTLMLLLAPRVALACPVCFGDATTPMAYAANRAILMMLVLVGGVLAGFASFFIYLVRRARLANPEPLTGDHAQPQEGTA
jgi:hypothetical protein